MKTRHSFLLALAFTLATASPALCASIVGIVFDTNGNAVNGVKISAADASGKQAGEATTDIHGRYCLGPLDPGKYTLKLGPAQTGFQPGTGVADLEEEGLTVDWSVSTQTAALATSTLGVASAAAATCGGAWWPAAAAAGGLAAIGGGIAGGILAGGGGGGGGGGPPPPMTSSK